MGLHTLRGGAQLQQPRVQAQHGDAGCHRVQVDLNALARARVLRELALRGRRAEDLPRLCGADAMPMWQ